MTEMTKALTPRRPPAAATGSARTRRPARAGRRGAGGGARLSPVRSRPAPLPPAHTRRLPSSALAAQPAQASGEHGACPLSGAAGGDPAVLLLYPVQLQGHRNALAPDLRRELEIPDVHRSGKAVLSPRPPARPHLSRRVCGRRAPVRTRPRHPPLSSPLPRGPRLRAWLPPQTPLCTASRYLLAGAQVEVGRSQVVGFVREHTPASKR